MKKNIIITILAILVLILAFFIISDLWIQTKGVMPPNGVVPDEETAIKIADAVWLAFYGEDLYNNTLPVKAELDTITQIWYVRGILPEDMMGGVPEIGIRKSDGKVLYVIQGK